MDTKLTERQGPRKAHCSTFRMPGWNLSSGELRPDSAFKAPPVASCLHQASSCVVWAALSAKQIVIAACSLTPRRGSQSPQRTTATLIQPQQDAKEALPELARHAMGDGGSDAADGKLIDAFTLVDVLVEKKVVCLEAWSSYLLIGLLGGRPV